MTATTTKRPPGKSTHGPKTAAAMAQREKREAKVQTNETALVRGKEIASDAEVARMALVESGAPIAELDKLLDVEVKAKARVEEAAHMLSVSQRLLPRSHADLEAAADQDRRDAIAELIKGRLLICKRLDADRKSMAQHVSEYFVNADKLAALTFGRPAMPPHDVIRGRRLCDILLSPLKRFFRRDLPDFDVTLESISIFERESQLFRPWSANGAKE